MNQNDLDRYFWCTGQRWSADSSSPKKPNRLLLTVFLILFFLVVTLLTLAYLRLSA
jgi:hypothetical protein